MPNKALLFDADGTLYDFPASERHALSRLFPSLGIPLNEDTVSLYQKENSLCWREYEQGLITVPELKEKRFTLFFSDIGLEADSHKAGNDFAEYLGEKGVLFPGAGELLFTLSQDHDLYIITNGFVTTQHRRFTAAGVDGCFKDIFISEKAGASKPNRAFFDYVFSQVPFTPEEALVIGDSETSDIRGARDYGIESVFISFSGKTSSLADHSVHSYQELLALIQDIDKRDVKNQV